MLERKTKQYRNKLGRERRNYYERNGLSEVERKILGEEDKIEDIVLKRET